MIRSERRGAVAIVTIDNPPVNALPVSGWNALAAQVLDAGRDPSVHVVILRAEGKGFQAGVDIKELAADDTNKSMVNVNRACFAAFAAVYECEVPVIAAVNGFCLGGGIGRAGNADIIVASDDATFAVPEIDRGALGTATHLARLVPPHKMRALFLTGGSSTAQQLFEYGSVERVVPREQLLDAALEIAGIIAAKSPLVVRRAKESFNMIDPVDVKRSYRMEQGYTFELNLYGDSDELRQAFVDKRDAELRSADDLFDA
jgi:enoyl-CoA hydratase